MQDILDVPLLLAPHLITNLLDIKDAEEFNTSLSTSLGITDYRDNARNHILLDFYCYLFDFAKENHFEAEKTSLLLSLISHLHNHSMSNRLDSSASYDLFKKLILHHCTASLPSSSPSPSHENPSISFNLPLSKLAEPTRPATPPTQPPSVPPTIITQQTSSHSQGKLAHLPSTSPTHAHAQPQLPTSSQAHPLPPTTIHALRSTASFTPGDVKAISLFLSSSYYLHYSLYLYVFTEAQDLHEEHLFVYVETPVVPLPLSKAYTEQEWANLQVQEHQHRIASELAFLKHNMQDSEQPEIKLDASGIPFIEEKEGGRDGGGASDDKQQASSHPSTHPHHPSAHASLLTSAQPLFSSLLHPHPHHSISAAASQVETQKILESVNQAAQVQITQLRDTLQKQFEDQERQILDLIARVDSELANDAAKQPQPTGERKRTPIKNSSNNLPTVASRPSTTTSNLTPKGNNLRSSVDSSHSLPSSDS